MNDATITVRVQTGWVRFLLAVADRLAAMRLRTLVALWLWVMQPFFIIRMQVADRWTFQRLPLRITLHRRREEQAS